MEPLPSATFAEQLTQLREAVSRADPLAILPADTASETNASATSAFADNATAVLASFTQATEPTRQTYVLHALDEAIAAIEMAVLLAENLHSQETPVSMPEGHLDSVNATSPLDEALHAFLESQPAYQALYHYRNALAARLHADTRALPDAVAENSEPTVAEESSH